jgi:hypothetical protein
LRPPTPPEEGQQEDNGEPINRRRLRRPRQARCCLVFSLTVSACGMLRTALVLLAFFQLYIIKGEAERRTGGAKRLP